MLYSTKFRNHKVEFQPYTSRQEKDILLACSTGAHDEIDQVYTDPEVREILHSMLK